MLTRLTSTRTLLSRNALHKPQPPVKLYVEGHRE
jgi:hypothetical protein